MNNESAKTLPKMDADNLASVEELALGGSPLPGALPAASYQEQRTALVSGDLLVMTTDGITEASGLG